MSLWSWVKQILLLLCKQAGGLQAGGLQHNLNTLHHTNIHLSRWTTVEFWVSAPLSLQRTEIRVSHVCETFKCKYLAWSGMGEATLQDCRRDCRAAERDPWFMPQVQKLEKMRPLPPRTNISFILSKCQQKTSISIQKSQLGTLLGTIITTLP